MPLTVTIWLHSLAIVVAAYLLGSIPSGYLLVRFFLKRDIRSIGSGNIGATNVLRSGNKGLGAATFLFDLMKGALAVLVGARLAHVGFPPLPVHNAEALAALSAVLGHMFPIWLELRGGKGVATAFGVFLVLAPWPALGSLLVFVVVFGIGRYVSLASLLGAAAFPLFAWFAADGLHTPWVRTPVVFGVMLIVATLIWIKHAQNVKRLLAGTEYRFGSKKIVAVPLDAGGTGANDSL